MTDTEIIKALELKPCPFCGSTKLKIESKSVFVGSNGLDQGVNRLTYSVRCNVCHARGGAASGKILSLYRFSIMQLPEWATTDIEIKKRAIEAWNRRAEE